MKAEECCAGASCRADATGLMRCLPRGAGCAAAGYPCVVAAQCCGGFCLPDAAGGYTCRDTCAPTGAACSTSEDCCGGSCLGAAGATVCATAGVVPADPLCISAGDTCSANPGACCAGTVCAQIAGGAHACAPAELP